MPTIAKSRLAPGFNRSRTRAGRRWYLLGFACIGLLAVAPRTSRGRVAEGLRLTRIEIRSAGAILPLAQRVAEGYMTEHPTERVVVSAGGNRRGLKSLILGTCEMALTATDLPDDLVQLAKDKNVELAATNIYLDAVVPVVHPKNPLRDISLEQLKDIYRGAVTNWSDISGKDASIVVITPAAASATFEIFKKAVLGDDAVITPKATVARQSELDAVLTEDAIAYTSLRGTKNLKILSVGGVSASVNAIATGKYPLRRTIRLYQRKPETPLGHAVLEDFLARDKGQAYVSALGDVPVNP